MKLIYALLNTILLVVAFCVLYLLYECIRRVTTFTKYGLQNLSTKMLKRGDYVSINGKVLRFVCISRSGVKLDPIAIPDYKNQADNGNLLFDNPNGLGYIELSPSILKKCEFVCEKYGLKWAISKEWKYKYKEKLKESFYD